MGHGRSSKGGVSNSGAAKSQSAVVKLNTTGGQTGGGAVGPNSGRTNRSHMSLNAAASTAAKPKTVTSASRILTPTATATPS